MLSCEFCEISKDSWTLASAILRSTLFLLYINDLPDVICNIAINVDDTTLYSKCDQASDLWKQIDLASELKSDPHDTVDWGKKWLVDFSVKKTQLISSDRSNSTSAIYVKMDVSVLEEKLSFKMQGFSFSSKIKFGLLHYHYCLNRSQENWSLDSKISFSWGCSLSL